MGKSTSEIVGRTIAGKFVVETLIGSGAMGAVYRARQVALEKIVAIKVLHREHADDATFAARFQREAKAASRLNHPNSMQVLDFGEEPDGLLYIAMEYLDGRSLHQVLREDGPLAPVRIADILMQTLAALAVAHDMGVVHRDLKPENVVVLRGTDDDGRPRDLVKVCDFGIAKITDSRAYRSGGGEAEAPVTTSGFLVGTPEYMSPEQGRGEKLDARSDLYSTGVMLFEMLCGRVPFEAENAIGVVLRHITEPPPRPSAIAPGCDPRLEAVCVRALHKSRDERYQSAREMRADLRPSVELPAAAVSAPELPGVRVMTAAPGLGHAATVALAAPVVPDGPAKATLNGTSAPIAGRPARGRALMALVALLAASLGVVLWFGRSPAGIEARPAAAVTSAPETTLVAEPHPGDVPPLEMVASAASSAAPRPVPAAHAAHSSSGRAAPSAVPSVAAAPPPAAPAVVAAVASAPAVPAPAAPPPAPAAEPSDPDFDPSRAYVEVGLINAQGVRERAVRAALHGSGFSGCYQRALRTRGARVVGAATLDLSVDEGGAIRSAIAAGAEFLPGLTRCIQGAAAALSLPRSQVDSGGGTAEVTLGFRVP